MRRNSTQLIKLIILCGFTVLITVFLYKTFHAVLTVYDEDKSLVPGERRNPIAEAYKRLRDSNNVNANVHPRQGSFFMGYPKNVNGKKIDWNDYALIEAERKRTGIGEQGVAASVPADREKERKKIFNQNGFNGLLSDMISVNRSVADIRHKE